jgi:hypothetical protein
MAHPTVKNLAHLLCRSMILRLRSHFLFAKVQVFEFWRHIYKQLETRRGSYVLYVRRVGKSDSPALNVLRHTCGALLTCCLSSYPVLASNF